MSDLVLLHHNEPMTTSLAIAEGTENTHQAIMKMVRTYVGQLQEFGEIGFEIRLNPHGKPTELAYLNEPQATLLITFLRNSEIVVRFKVALVKAFFELRDRLRSQTPQFTTRQLDHGADLAVAADRTFRGFLRSARAAGLRLPAALRVANAQTVVRTGMNMLEELGVNADDAEPGSAVAPDPLRAALARWETLAGSGPWRLDDILFDACGVRPMDAEYKSLRARAGKVLAEFGIRGRKVSNAHGQYRQWERRKF